MEFTPPASSENVRLVKQNMISSLSLNGWATLDTSDKGTTTPLRFPSIDCLCSDPAVSILGVLETPPILKISQRQFTFIMRLVDELGAFLDIIDRSTAQTALIKQKLSIEAAINDMKMTICLAVPTTFTLAVIDSLESTMFDLPTSSSVSSREAEIDLIARDEPPATVLEDVVIATPVAPATPLPTKVELPKNPSIPVPKKSRFEENLHRGFEFIAKGSRGSSVASSVNMSDNSDDTLSQLDITEDLDAELDASLFASDFEQQKAARIELDEDSLSLLEKKSVRNTALETVRCKTSFTHQPIVSLFLGKRRLR